MRHAQVLRESDGGAVELGRHVYDLNKLLHSVTSSGTRFMHYDAQRSVRTLSSSTQPLVDAYLFDAFGRSLGGTGSSPNSYRYAGERVDGETSLIHLRARQYDPNSGRFFGADSMLGNSRRPATLQRYNYAEADPMGLSDPSGRFSIGSIGVSIAVLTALVSIPSNIFGHSGFSETQEYSSRMSLAWARFYSSGLDSLGGTPSFDTWWLPSQAKDVARGWTLINRALRNLGSTDYGLGDPNFKAPSGNTCTKGGGVNAYLMGSQRSDGLGLCPDFFDLPELPGGGLWKNQAGVWVHEISHFADTFLDLPVLGGTLIVGGTNDHTMDTHGEKGGLESREDVLEWLRSAPNGMTGEPDAFQPAGMRLYNAYVWEAQFNDYVIGLGSSW